MSLDHTAHTELDEKFILPVVPLRSNRIDLIPLNQARDIPLIWDAVKNTSEVYQYMNDGPFDRREDMLHSMSQHVDNPKRMKYAVYTSPTSETNEASTPHKVLAGWIGITGVDVEKMTASIGILIFKPFHQTHVTTHTCGLVLHRLLDPPDRGGYGFKCIQWDADKRNIASQNAALRLGFMTVSSCHMLAEDCVQGEKADKWVAYLSVDHWEDKARDHVDQLMKRTT